MVLSIAVNQDQYARIWPLLSTGLPLRCASIIDTLILSECRCPRLTFAGRQMQARGAVAQDNPYTRYAACADHDFLGEQYVVLVRGRVGKKTR